MLRADRAFAACGCDENIGFAQHIFNAFHGEAFHSRLESAYRVYLGDDHTGALASQSLGAAFAHIAVAADHGDLAADHHVGRSVDAVNEGMTAAVEVVKLGFRDRIVHIHGWEQQFACFSHVIEAVHACGGFFRHAPHALGQLRPKLRFSGLAGAQERKHHSPFVAVVFCGVGHCACSLVFHALVEQQGGVAAVVDYEGGSDVGCSPAAVGRPAQHLLGAPPIFLYSLALPREDWDAFGVV